MLHWRELIKNVDQKDIEEYGVFREAPDSDKNHRLNGVVVSKKTTKSYNIVCMMDTQTFQENTSMKVFCNCEDFAFTTPARRSWRPWRQPRWRGKSRRARTGGAPARRPPAGHRRGTPRR